MRRLPPLFAYAVVSLAIVVGSLVAMAPSLGDVRPGAERTAAAAIAPAPLSTTGRLAYWRPSPGDDLELWVSDLEGKRRLPIAVVPKEADVRLTRWSPDGEAVAWASDGEVHVVRLDRTRTTVSLPAVLPTDWWPVTLEWSPGSSRLAATLRAARGLANEGDLFVADLAGPATTWVRRTGTGDTYAGPWIDEDRLLIETAGATIGILSAAGTAPARPLTGMPAVSPRVGVDGRLYFFGGRWGGAALFSGPLAAGSVWSMTIGGDDLRRETVAERDQGRLQGSLYDGRFIVGVPGALYVVGDEAVLFPWKTGGARRAVVSQDGRQVVAMTETRVLGADVSKIPRSAGSGEPPADATTVLLDGVQAADAWFPSRPVALAHSAARAVDGPREALTFSFSRSLWQLLPGGEMRSIVAAPAGGWLSGVSPSRMGGHFVATVSAPRASDGRPEPTTMILDPQGTRVMTFAGAVSTVSWSPDDTQIALSVWSDTDGYALQLYDTATWKAGDRFERTRGVWSVAGLVLIDEGRPHPAAQPSQSPWFRVGQGIDLLTETGTVRITDADRLATHPLLRELAGAGAEAQVSQILPSRSAGHLIVSLSYFGADGRNVNNALALVRTRDGEPVTVLGTNAPMGLTDLTWAPASELLGGTRWISTYAGVRDGLAVVMDVSGRVVLERAGQFAGWSASGEWVYRAARRAVRCAPRRVDGGTHRAARRGACRSDAALATGLLTTARIACKGPRNT